MVNLPRGREISGLHGVRSLFQGAILRLVRLYGLSVSFKQEIPTICAWNTPGAALLVGGLATLLYNQSIGAYLGQPQRCCSWA
jgi:predicted benzoate:H+ symporter BenE